LLKYFDKVEQDFHFYLLTHLSGMSAASHSQTENSAFPPHGNFRVRGGGRMEFLHEVNGEAEKIFISRASNIVEALCNLTYLICVDADHPEKVRQYAGICEEQLQVITRLLDESASRDKEYQRKTGSAEPS
jgi:hypothetical protein